MEGEDALTSDSWVPGDGAPQPCGVQDSRGQKQYKEFKSHFCLDKE